MQIGESCYADLHNHNVRPLNRFPMVKKAKADLRPAREKTLTELEGEDWGPPTYNSHLVTTVHRLRYVPINQFNIEDLRIVIGQHIGLPWLVPIALEHLEKDAFVSGDFYPGDLLKNVATIPKDFWASRRDLRDRAKRVVEGALDHIQQADTVPELEQELRCALGQLDEAAAKA